MSYAGVNSAKCKASPTRALVEGSTARWTRAAGPTLGLRVCDRCTRSPPCQRHMLHNRFFPCVAPLSTLIADAGTKPLSWPMLQLGGAAKPSRSSSCWILLSNIHRKRRVSFSVPTDRDVGRLGLAHWALCQVPGTRQRATNRLRSLGPARMQLEKDFTPTQHPWTLPPSEDNCPLCLVAVDVLVMYLVHPSLSTSHTHGCRRPASFVRCTTVVPTSGQQTLLLRSWLMGLAASAILMTRSTQGENSLTRCQLAVCLPCFSRPS